MYAGWNRVVNDNIYMNKPENIRNKVFLDEKITA